MLRAVTVLRPVCSDSCMISTQCCRLGAQSFINKYQAQPFLPAHVSGQGNGFLLWWRAAQHGVGLRFARPSLHFRQRERGRRMREREKEWERRERMMMELREKEKRQKFKKEEASTRWSLGKCVWETELLKDVFWMILETFFWK